MPPANDASKPPSGPGKQSRPPKRPRSLAWRAFFTTFKWCRIIALLIVFTIIILGLFLNHVGLPDWLERRVEEQFRASGWEVKFSKLRLRWYRGIVAEGLQLQRTNTVDGPNLFLQTAEFRLNWKAFRHLDLEASGVMLSGGRLMWPIPGTNQPQRTFVLESIGGELVFGSDDRWELKFIEAEVLGTHVRIRGDITNVALLRNWKLPVQRPRDPAARSASDLWHSLLEQAEKVKFDGRPEFNVIFGLDAQRWQQPDVKLKFTATALESPWASGTNVNLSIDLLPPPQTNDAIRVDLKATAQMARTPWASATNLDLKFVFEPSFTSFQPTNSLLLLDVLGAETPWGRAGHVFAELRSNPSSTNAALRETRADVSVDSLAADRSTARRARLVATLVHSPGEFLPATAQTTWSFHDLQTSEAVSQWARVETTLALPAMAEFRLGRTNLTWPERLQNLPFVADVTFSNTSIARLVLDRVALRAAWQFPQLRLTSAGQLESDSATMQAAVDTRTRAMNFSIDGSLDPMRFARFVSTNVLAWGGDLVLTSAPVASIRGRLTLPDPDQRNIDWRRDVLPSVQLAGRIETGGGRYRSVPFTTLRVPATFTNSAWAIREASFAQDSGALNLSGEGDAARREFAFRLRSDFNLLTLRPALPQSAATYFDWFEWQVPPLITAELRGNWTNLSVLGASGAVAFTNAAFREQQVHSATARFVYTNKLLSILEPFVLRKGEWGAADGIALDLAAEKLYLTNAVGKMAPRVITRAIGPRIDNVVAPYVFEGSPDAKTHGVFALKPGDNSHDVRFEVDGGPFHWERFHLEKARAVLLWKGDTLTITNVTGRWHGAKVDGSAFFDFDRTLPGGTFSFQARVGDGDLRRILKDLEPGRQGKVEGRIDGELVVTRANTDDWKSWQGYGQARMTDGLLWDIPLFGVFSPVLNTVLPGAGLGNSRAREATMTYQITNSVILTRDLEIRATAMRMHYDGTVDFDQRVNGRMEADLLRDLPVFGLLISKVLLPVTKLFEYEITGTLNNPTTKERYFISKLLLAPLHPLKTLKDIFNPPGGEEPSSTRPPERPKSP